MALLEIKELKTFFNTKRGVIKAVNGVSYSVDAGRTLGVVGESGSGKSVSAMSILRLLDDNGFIESGSIVFDGRELTRLSMNEMYKIRGNQISVIFQEPMTSMDPVMLIGPQVEECLKNHSRLSREELHGLQTQRKRDLDIARVRRAGADRDADLLAVLDGGRVQTRGDDELRAGGHRAIHLLAGEHGARADDHIRERFGHVLDRVCRGGGAEGDLRARQTAVNQRLRKRHGVRRVVDGDNRHDADSGKLLHHIHIVFPPSEYSECIYAICRPKAAKGCVISERNPRASG